MPRAPRLKVYRTAIGFHDAYVAAPSQKAALAAWHSDKDLFARGLAEQVTDAALGAAPLAAPGTVVKRLRGTVEEQIAALPPDRPRTAPAPDVPAKPARAPKPKRPPRPSRAALDEAERAIGDAEARRSEALADLRQREQAIARERRAIEQREDQAMRALVRVKEEAERAYRAALDDWTALG